MRRMTAVIALCIVLLLAACSSGPVRRVSQPAASIQQLTVQADGSWSVQLRINNYSSVPMRFDNVNLSMQLGAQKAGTVLGQPALSIGPESADVATITFTPLPATRMVIADALASGRSIDYTLQGTLSAAPDNGKARNFDIKHASLLSPVPGLPGVLR